MKFLSYLCLLFAAADAWPNFERYPVRTVASQYPLASVHLIRDCLISPCEKPISCKRHVTRLANRTTLLLLNFTLDTYHGHGAGPRTVDLFLLITCGEDVGNLTLILHQHDPTPDRSVIWTPSVRQCRHRPRLLESSAKSTAGGWKWSEVQSRTQLTLTASRAVIVEAHDESESQSWLANSTSSCPAVGKSIFIPQDSILISNYKSRFYDGVSWVHVTHIDLCHQRPTVRADLVFPQRWTANSIFVCILTVDSSLPLLLNVAVVVARAGPPCQLHVLSNKRVVMDKSSDLLPVKLSVDDQLSYAQLGTKITDYDVRLIRRRRVTFSLESVLPMMASPTILHPNLLIRVNVTKFVKPSFKPSIFQAPQHNHSLSRVLRRSACLPDGHMLFEIDAGVAADHNLRPSQLSVNDIDCHFEAARGVQRQTWRLRFALASCGSAKFDNVGEGRVIYTNTLKAYPMRGPPVRLKTLVCPTRAHERQDTSGADLSYSPLPDQSLAISYTSDKFEDYHILACGVQGSYLPIYNIYCDNQSVENQLLQFDILPKKKPNHHDFVLRFKNDYPHKSNPYKVFCLVEGCKKDIIDKIAADNSANCRSGEQILRSKEVLALVTVKWDAKSKKSGVRDPHHVRLKDSLLIWAAAFLFGVISVSCILLIRARHHRRRPLQVQVPIEEVHS